MKTFKTSLSVVVRLLLWLLMLVGGSAIAIYYDWDHPWFQSVTYHVISLTLGIGVSTLAFRAAANGGRELAKGRVGNIPRLETNRLVTTGIYRCMRHPMLFGLTLLPLGWGLLLGSPTFVGIIAPLEMLFIVVMVSVFEEREVQQKFPRQYAQYRQDVPMVNFSLPCLKRLFRSLS